ncbi:MAG: helix-turn-helix domain-containing protein [bacterium]|nr:helix-turn-helix domain-containing protein [bacterium]
MDILPLELRKLGLKEKEARVYLAGLELGPESLQNIARKSEITRPTAYGIVRALQEKGLFREVQQGKKRLFVANSPEKILNILRLQKRELEEKEREFIRIIAALESRYALKDGGIQIFKGKEGLQVLQEQILYTTKKDIIVFTSEKAQTQRWYVILQKRLGRLSIQEKIVPSLQGTLFLGEKAIFISAKKQEGYLIDNPLVVNSLKHLV